MMCDPDCGVLVVATSNRHKYGEMVSLLESVPFRLASLSDFDGIEPVEEGDGSYFENASLKARSFSKQTGCPAIADDTGLEIECLGGAPGIRSARFFGESVPYEERNRSLLELVDNAGGSRAARFVCHAVIASGDEIVASFEGELRGSIANSPDGRGGFGYDPIFFVDSLGVTLASVPPEVKNRISHRAVAFSKAAEFLRSFKSR